MAEPAEAVGAMPYTQPPEPIRADMAVLAGAYPAFARAAASPAPFPAMFRPPGFATLLRIILSQQVSTASAQAMAARLDACCRPLTPAAFGRLGDDVLRACGFSRQKMRYGRALAEAIESGGLDLDAVHRMDDEAAIAALSALPGIGRWSAECYLLFSLGRADILPAADLALQVGWQWLSGAAERPSSAALRHAGEAWRPRRTAASLLLWKHYLGVMADRRDAARGGLAKRRAEG